MKALTIWQPWASLLARGVKQFPIPAKGKQGLWNFEMEVSV